MNPTSIPNYVGGKKIVATDYNIIAIGGNTAPNTSNISINKILGFPSNVDGDYLSSYGYKTLISSVTAGQQVLSSSWSVLSNAINAILNHQGTSAINWATNQNTPIIAKTNLASSITNAWNNRLNCITQNPGAGSSFTLNSSVNNSPGSTFSQTLSVNFQSSEDVYFFFNSGGQIKLNFSQIPGSLISEQFSSTSTSYQAINQTVNFDFDQINHLSWNNASFNSTTNIPLTTDILNLNNIQFSPAIPDNAVILNITVTFTKQASINNTNDYIADSQLALEINGSTITSYSTDWKPSPYLSSGVAASSSACCITPVYCRVFPTNNPGVVSVVHESIPLFTQHFSNLTFNTHPNSYIPGFNEGSANDAPPFLSHNEVDINGYYVTDITVGGNGYTVGRNGNLPTWNMVFTGAFVISPFNTSITGPFSHTFLAAIQNGWILGIGPAVGTTQRPTLIGNNFGYNSGAQGYSNTPFENYPLICGDNNVHRYNNPSPGAEFTISFPQAGIYPFEFCWGGEHFAGDIYSMFLGLIDNGLGLVMYPAVPKNSAWSTAPTSATYQMYNSSTGPSLHGSDIKNSSSGLNIKAISYRGVYSSGPTLVGSISNMNLNVTYLAQTLNPKDAAWADLANSCGEIFLSSPGSSIGISTATIAGRTFTGTSKIGGDSFYDILTTNNGYRDIPNNTLIFKESVGSNPGRSSSPYKNNNISLFAQYVGSSIVFNINWADTVFDGNNNSGNFIATVTAIPSETSNINNTWGTVTCA